MKSAAEFSHPWRLTAVGVGLLTWLLSACDPGIASGPRIVAHSKGAPDEEPWPDSGDDAGPGGEADAATGDDANAAARDASYRQDASGARDAGGDAGGDAAAEADAAAEIDGGTGADAAIAADAAGTGGAIDWFEWPAQNSSSEASWGAVLTDVMQHCPPGEAYFDSDRVTQAHESTHGIDTHLGLSYTPWTGWNAFYVLEDRALLIREPGIRKAQVAPYVPQHFRRSRYDLYLAGQQAWDDHPLYVWEEWIAYTNGTAAGVDQAQSGLWNQGWRDACMGTLEFVVYGLAVGLAVEELDPSYFAEETDFRAFLAFSVQRALDVYRDCAVLPSFSWEVQDAYYQALRSGPEGAVLRAFVERTYGEDYLESALALD